MKDNVYGKTKKRKMSFKMGNFFSNWEINTRPINNV